jgi:hypothetical protein
MDMHVTLPLLGHRICTDRRGHVFGRTICPSRMAVPALKLFEKQPHYLFHGQDAVGRTRAQTARIYAPALALAVCETS